MYYRFIYVVRAHSLSDAPGESGPIKTPKVTRKLQNSVGPLRGWGVLLSFTSGPWMQTLHERMLSTSSLHCDLLSFRVSDVQLHRFQTALMPFEIWILPHFSVTELGQYLKTGMNPAFSNSPGAHRTGPAPQQENTVELWGRAFITWQ